MFLIKPDKIYQILD